jgi:hypothetical protein
MSTDAFLSINRCFKEMFPSAMEDVQCLTILSLDKPELKRLPIEQQLIKLHERMPYHKTNRIGARPATMPGQNGQTEI